MYKALKLLRTWSPVLLALTVLLMRSHIAFAAIDIPLDDGFKDAESKIKSWLLRGLQVFGLVSCGIGVGVAAFKLSRKDPEAVWYLAGAAGAAAVFIVAGAMLE